MELGEKRLAPRSSPRRTPSNHSSGSSHSMGQSRDRMKVKYLLNEEEGRPGTPSAHSERLTGRGRGDGEQEEYGWDGTGAWEGRGTSSGIRGGKAVTETPKSIMVRSDSGGMGVRGRCVEKGRRGVGEGKVRRFVCETCGFAFAMKSNLKRHRQTVHQRVKEFLCEYCGSMFGLKQNLLTHIRVRHERRKDFVCEVCGEEFGYKQVLQNHCRNIHGM